VPAENKEIFLPFVPTHLLQNLRVQSLIDKRFLHSLPQLEAILTWRDEDDLTFSEISAFGFDGDL